jgi:hypothetical protein
LAAAPRAVELFAGVVVDADVMHLDGAARHGLGSVADHQVLADKSSRCWAAGKFNLRFA